MRKEDYDYFENTLRELSSLLRRAREEESWRISEFEMAQRLRHFYVVGSSPPEEEKKKLESLRHSGAVLTLPAQSNEDSQLNKRDELGIFENFSEQEIKKMPKLKELSYRYRAQYGIHEFRYRRNGICLSFASKDIKIAKRKALEFCRDLNSYEGDYVNKSILFIDFARDYLYNVKKKNVTEKTFNNEINRFNNHVIPNFKGIKLKDIRAPFIQRVLNNILDAGQKRTAESVYYILKTVLDYAVNNDYIKKNPLCAVKIPLHERVTGVALSLDAERKFLSDIAGTKYELTFIVLLYTGCRPCELESISFERDGFLTFRNRKQKKNAVVFKDIPITPMLEPYVDVIKNNLPLKQTTELTKIFKDFVPEYRLYDLRHTFATRCQTCGVPQYVVSRWLGHSAKSITDGTYTHFPPEFMLKEAKKVVY